MSALPPQGQSTEVYTTFYSNEYSRARDELVETNDTDFVVLLLHVLSNSQRLCEQGQGTAENLRDVVRESTQGAAELLLHHRYVPENIPMSIPQTFITLTVEYNSAVYGALHIFPDSRVPRQSALPLDVAYLLAQTCGWILHTFELASLVHGRCQKFNRQPRGKLTKREKEILLLISRGYDHFEIAERLNICIETVKKHRQHIYGQLNVHNERDALLAAYGEGLLTPFQDAVDE